MDVKFFYIKGYQPKGGKRIWFYVLWFFILMLLFITSMTIFFSKDGIRDNHYLYIFVIVLWLLLSPFIKPKGLEIDPKNKTISLISLFGNFRLSKIDISTVLSLDVFEDSDAKIDMVLSDGSRKTFHIDDRNSFVEEYNNVKNNGK